MEIKNIQSQTLNEMFSGVRVDFNSLKDVADGRYNMGEIDARLGKNNVLTFGKINNHVSQVSKNIDVRTTAMNERTNRAVFKAILDRFGGNSFGVRQDDLIKEVENTSLGTEQGVKTVAEKLNGFANPYVKVAFDRLVANATKGDPLSRDEMKMLLSLLEDAEKKLRTDREQGGRSGYNKITTSLKHSSEMLDALHRFKKNGFLEKDGASADSTRLIDKGDESNIDVLLTNAVKGYITGLNVRPSAAVRDRLLEASVNQRENRGANDKSRFGEFDSWNRNWQGDARPDERQKEPAPGNDKAPGDNGIAAAVSPSPRKGFSEFREHVDAAALLGEAPKARRTALRPMLEQFMAREDLVKGLKRDLFLCVFKRLIPAGQDQGDPEAEAVLRRDYKAVSAYFDEEWGRLFSIDSSSVNILYGQLNDVVEQYAKLNGGSCGFEDAIDDADFRNSFLGAVRETLEKSLMGTFSDFDLDRSAKYEEFTRLFENLKNGFDSRAMLATVAGQTEYKAALNNLGKSKMNALNAKILELIDGFAKAKNFRELPPRMRALCSVKHEGPDAFKNAVIRVAVGLLSPFASLENSGSAGNLLSPDKETVATNTAPGTMKATLRTAIERNKGIAQAGPLNCFIKSVVNSMLGTDQGRAILSHLIDDKGDYHFRGYDRATGQRFEAETVIAREQIDRARTTGSHRNAYAAMDDLEIAVWLALESRYPDQFSYAPGDVGEANLVANLFGYKSALGEPDAGDLGQWANAATTLRKGGLAVYRNSAGVGHFLSIRATSNVKDGAGSAYRFADSLNSTGAAGLNLGANFVLCYEYVPYGGDEESVPPKGDDVRGEAEAAPTEVDVAAEPEKTVPPEINVAAEPEKTTPTEKAIPAFNFGGYPEKTAYLYDESLIPGNNAFKYSEVKLSGVSGETVGAWVPAQNDCVPDSVVPGRRVEIRGVKYVWASVLDQGGKPLDGNSRSLALVMADAKGAPPALENTFLHKVKLEVPEKLDESAVVGSGSDGDYEARVKGWVGKALAEGKRKGAFDNVRSAYAFVFNHITQEMFPPSARGRRDEYLSFLRNVNDVIGNEGDEERIYKLLSGMVQNFEADKSQNNSMPLFGDEEASALCAVLDVIRDDRNWATGAAEIDVWAKAPQKVRGVNAFDMLSVAVVGDQGDAAKGEAKIARANAVLTAFATDLFGKKIPEAAKASIERWVGTLVLRMEALRGRSDTDPQAGNFVKLQMAFESFCLDLEACLGNINAKDRENCKGKIQAFRDAQRKECLAASRITDGHWAEALRAALGLKADADGGNSIKARSEVSRFILEAAIESQLEQTGSLNDYTRMMVSKALRDVDFSSEDAAAELKKSGSAFLQELRDERLDAAASGIEAVFGEDFEALAPTRDVRGEEPAPAVDEVPAPPLFGGKGEFFLNPRFLREDLDDLKHFARSAFDEANGRKGGRGYMGFKDGLPVNFLTNEGEAVGAEDEGAKPVVGKAMQNLLAAFQRIAGKFSPDLAAEVRRVLTSQGTTLAGIGQMIRRTDVARAIDLIVDFVEKEYQVKLSIWDDPEVTAPNRVGKTDIRSALAQNEKVANAVNKLTALKKGLNDTQKAFLDDYMKEYNDLLGRLSERKVSAEDRRAAIIDFKYRKATDPAWQNQAYDLFKDICAPVTFEEIECAIQAFPGLKRDVQRLFNADGDCSTTFGLSQLLGDFNVTLVAGDNTLYQGLQTANSQEEATFHDMSPIATAVLLKLGYIEPFEYTTVTNPLTSEKISLHRFRYVENPIGLSKLNTCKGYLLRSFMDSRDRRAVSTYKGTILAMCAMPSFGVRASEDSHNFGQSIYDRVDDHRPSFNGEDAHDQKMIGNAMSFYGTTHKGKVKKTKTKSNPEGRSIESCVKEKEPTGGLKFGAYQTNAGKVNRFDELLMIATYGNYVNPCSDDPEGQVWKLFELVDSGKHRPQLEAAIANYKLAIQKRMDDYVRMMMATGAQNIQLCGIGLSAFRNSGPLVMDALAKAIVKYGGGRAQSLYLNLYHEDKDEGLYAELREAIKRHQDEVVGLLVKDGVTIRELIRGFLGNGNSESEIIESFGKEGLSEKMVRRCLLDSRMRMMPLADVLDEMDMKDSGCTNRDIAYFALHSFTNRGDALKALAKLGRKDPGFVQSIVAELVRCGENRPEAIKSLLLSAGFAKSEVVSGLVAKTGSVAYATAVVRMLMAQKLPLAEIVRRLQQAGETNEAIVGGLLGGEVTAKQLVALKDLPGLDVVAAKAVVTRLLDEGPVDAAGIRAKARKLKVDDALISKGLLNQSAATLKGTKGAVEALAALVPDLSVLASGLKSAGHETEAIYQVLFEAGKGRSAAEIADALAKTEVGIVPGFVFDGFHARKEKIEGAVEFLKRQSLDEGAINEGLLSSRSAFKDADFRKDAAKCLLANAKSLKEISDLFKRTGHSERDLIQSIGNVIGKSEVRKYLLRREPEATVDKIVEGLKAQPGNAGIAPDSLVFLLLNYGDGQEAAIKAIARLAGDDKALSTALVKELLAKSGGTDKACEKIYRQLLDGGMDEGVIVHGFLSQADQRGETPEPVKWAIRFFAAEPMNVKISRIAEGLKGNPAGSRTDRNGYKVVKALLSVYSLDELAAKFGQDKDVDRAYVTWLVSEKLGAEKITDLLKDKASQGAALEKCKAIFGMFRNAGYDARDLIRGVARASAEFVRFAFRNRVILFGEEWVNPSGFIRNLKRDDDNYAYEHRLNDLGDELDPAGDAANMRQWVDADRAYIPELVKRLVKKSESGMSHSQAYALLIRNLGLDWRKVVAATGDYGNFGKQDLLTGVTRCLVEWAKTQRLGGVEAAGPTLDEIKAELKGIGIKDEEIEAKA